MAAIFDGGHKKREATDDKLLSRQYLTFLFRVW